VGKPKPYNPRQLTKHLRELAAEIHTIEDDGTMLTRGEALALEVWKRALGYEDRLTDDEGKESCIKVPPAQWAIQMVFDRMEGRTPQAIEEEETRVSAAEKVRELSASRINGMAKKAVVKTHGEAEQLKRKGPPSLKPGEGTDAK
jgi:hypothetical protein